MKSYHTPTDSLSHKYDQCSTNKKTIGQLKSEIEEVRVEIIKSNERSNSVEERLSSEMSLHQGKCSKLLLIIYDSSIFSH